MFKRVIKDLFAVFNLMMIVTLIVAFFFLIAGCATPRQDLLGIMGELDKELENKGKQWDEPYYADPDELGWVSINDDGNFWVFRTEQGIIATCTYTYMKVSGIELWKGKMNNMRTDFGFDGAWVATDLDNLAGCVEWVSRQLMGGYYIGYDNG